MSAVPKVRYTLEEYIELEQRSDERFEYFDGEVFSMAGGSLDHARISANIIRALSNRLDDSDCEALTGDVRIKTPALLPYRYPDVSVVCGKAKTETLLGQEMLLNPVLIVEVLSPSTAAFDLDAKFSAYQSIKTFREYLLVYQTQPRVVHFIRQARGKWLRSEANGMDEVIQLESLNITLPLAEIYRQIKFQPGPLSLVNPTPPATL